MAPIPLAKEIIDRIAPIRAERLRLSAEKMGKVLRFPATNSGDAVKRLKDEGQRLSPAEQMEEMRKILDMARAEQVGLNVGGKPAQSSTSPKPLRTPEQKPKSAKAED